MPAKVRVFEGPEELAEAAARLFVEQAERAIGERGRFTVALSGGSTPDRLYRLLISCTLPWERVHLFWGDERHVPPDHADSNYRAASEALLDRVAVPPENVHRIYAEEASAARAADAYERELQAFFVLDDDESPRFDLVLLGLGVDGHTASLFPHSAGLDETGRLVVAHRVDALDADRITLTTTTINQARCILFLVAGASKAEALERVLEGDHRPRELPSQLIRPERGELLWYIDRAAAGRLSL